jgi:hypothetical protein
MEKIDKNLRQYNPYCATFKQMHQVEKEEEQKANLTGNFKKHSTFFFLISKFFYNYFQRANHPSSSHGFQKAFK